MKVRYGDPNPWQNYVCDSTGENCTVVQVSNRAQRHYLTQAFGSADNACNTCGFSGSFSATVDASGNKTSYTDGNGWNTYYTYDNNGNMISKYLPDVNTGGYDVWNYTYNSFGEVLTVTDPLGAAAGDPNHTTVNAYDANGNLLSTTTPSPDGSTSGSTTNFTYNSNGTLKNVQDPLGNTTTITYYSTGLINKITDASGNVSTYAYDNRGNRTSVTDAVGNQTGFQYDSMNRLTKITYADNSTVQFAYDWRGRRTSVTDQKGNTTQYSYDDADRLVSVTDAQTPTAGVTSYGFDTENDLTDIWDAAGNHTQFLYFPGKYLYKAIFPSGQYETYQFDGNNNLAYKTHRNSNSIIYSYDHQNRVNYKEDPGFVFYTYDPAGRLTQVEDYNSGNRAEYDFAYDNMNRLTSTTTNYEFTSIGALTVQYGYDAASNRVSMTDPQGTQTSYAYDNLNRLTSLSNSWAGAFGFSYDALSRRTQLTRPNGVNTNYTYDNLSRLLSVLHQAGSTTLDGATYTYDVAGNRLSKTDLYASVTSNYAYDAIYQLLQVTQGTSTTESYTYDIVGNRLSSPGMSSYAYNSSNELTSTALGSYTYDHNGNTLTDAQGRSYTWDFENRMTQAVMPGTNGGTTTFKYDPFGRRIQKSGPLGTTNYLYNGPNLLQDIDNSGNVLVRYTQGAYVDELLSELQSGTTSYYEEDGLGSVTSLSNSAGALANTYTYDSFGKLTASTGTTVNPFQYTAREFDQETGGYFYRARYYDQSIGRFVSEDPIGIKGGPNFYDYVSDDPVDLIDPPGLSPRPVPPYRWRNCTPVEESQCKSTCAAQGTEFESCRVSQRYRILSLKDGPVWADGPISCSCKEPDGQPCPNAKPKTTPLIPILPIIEDILEGLAAAAAF